MQIRSRKGGYCSFHNENHTCITGCDGHYKEECLGSLRFGRNFNESPDTWGSPYVNYDAQNNQRTYDNVFDQLTGVEGSCDFSEIEEIVSKDLYS